jgi:hypothetical protein
MIILLYVQNLLGGREVRSVGGGPESEGGVVGGPGSVHDLCERELAGVHRTAAGLQSKIVHLEKLLENTENALKINQNQNAGKYFLLN